MFKEQVCGLMNLLCVDLLCIFNKSRAETVIQSKPSTFPNPGRLSPPTLNPSRPWPFIVYARTTVDNSCWRVTHCLGHRRTVRSVLRFSFACGLRPRANLNPRTPLAGVFSPMLYVERQTAEHNFNNSTFQKLKPSTNHKVTHSTNRKVKNSKT